MKILILSPHADDAAFSCGDHIIQWKNQSNDVTVCTVFSRFLTSIVSKDVNWYLNNSGFSDVYSFEKGRNREDKNALKYLNVSFITPKLIDGAFRTVDNQLVYNSFNELFSGKISYLDESVIKDFNQFLNSIKKNYDFIMAPLGIGNHADHLITSLCAKKCIPPNKLIFYIDVPYYFSLSNWNHHYIKTLFLYKKSVKWTTKLKLKCLDYYPSQKPLIIRNNRKFFFNEQSIVFPEIILAPKNISLTTFN